MPPIEWVLRLCIIWVLGSCSSSWISWFGFWFPRPKKVLYDCSLIVPSKVKGIVPLFLQDHFSKAQKCHKLFLKRVHEFGNQFWAKSDFRGISAVNEQKEPILYFQVDFPFIQFQFLSFLLCCTVLKGFHNHFDDAICKFFFAAPWHFWPG